MAGSAGTTSSPKSGPLVDLHPGLVEGRIGDGDAAQLRGLGAILRMGGGRERKRADATQR